MKFISGRPSYSAALPLLVLLSFLFVQGMACSEELASLSGRVTVTPLTVDFPLMSLRIKILATAPIEITSGTFNIIEDDIPISNIIIASAVPRQGLVLLLDRSSSLENSISDIRRSAALFLESLPSDVKTSVISFASDVEINQDFTTVKKELTHAVETIRAWGGTSLYDALYLGIEMLYANTDPRDLRTIVLFTDGKDETPVGNRQMSTRNLSEVITAARKRNVRIISVGMGSLIDEKVLLELTRETHGWYLFAPTSKDLAGLYQKIVQRMRQERHFTVSYLTPNPKKDASKHKIRFSCRFGGNGRDIDLEYEAPLDKYHVDHAVTPASVRNITSSKSASIELPPWPGKSEPASTTSVSEGTKSNQGSGSNMLDLKIRDDSLRRNTPGNSLASESDRGR
ncbi:MAG: VWA domain-containing protein [Candidatus Riflebacteria bacterium]|nr:VWA domain-containing protein [Candidatus Riflebacteria bacterium]